MSRREFTVDPQEMIATLLALAAERRRPVKVPRKEVARRCELRRRSMARKTRQAVDRSIARLKRPNTKRLFGERIVDRMVAAMEPGQWYGVPDLMVLIGGARSARGKVRQGLLRQGIVQRRRNAEYQAPRYGARTQPKWLYRLTERGRLVRELLGLLGVR